MNATLEPTKEALILSGEGYSLEVAPNILAQKEALLSSAALIIVVESPAGSEAAGGQIKQLAAMRNLVEKSRKTVKEPVLEVGKRIDAIASEFQASLNDEEQRLKRLQGDYAVLVEKERQRVLAEMEKARQAEQKRIADEAAAAAKAEADRIAAEQAAFDATTPEEDAAAEQAAEHAKAAELARLEAAAKAQSVVVTPAFIPEAPKGVKFEWDYVVTDAFALLNHNTGLVDLVPKRAAILERIKGMAIGDEAPVIPGLIINKVAKVSIR